MERIVLASSNRGKIREIQEALAFPLRGGFQEALASPLRGGFQEALASPLRGGFQEALASPLRGGFQTILGEGRYIILPQSDFAIPDAAETGLTFVENAILKARNAAHHSGLPAIADDSGLAVDWLDGAPGIYSARYAGVGASDQANLDKLLKTMADVPDEQRGARFICAMVFLRHAADPCPIIAHGVWEGRILHQARGEHGFGYDPIFLVPEQQCASAELPPPLKNQLSHRGQALRMLCAEMHKLR